MLNLVKKLISLLLTPLKALFDFPVVPEDVSVIITTAIGYFDRAIEIVAFFCPLPLMYALLGVVVAIELIEHSYYLVMWIVKKIPFLGVE